MTPDFLLVPRIVGGLFLDVGTTPTLVVGVEKGTLESLSSYIWALSTVKVMDQDSIALARLKLSSTIRRFATVIGRMTDCRMRYIWRWGGRRLKSRKMSRHQRAIPQEHLVRVINVAGWRGVS